MSMREVVGCNNIIDELHILQLVDAGFKKDHGKRTKLMLKKILRRRRRRRIRKGRAGCKESLRRSI